MMVTAMDDRPLAESEKILVQIGTTARLLGWIEREATFEAEGEKIAGKEIVDTGRPPWRIAHSHLRLTVRNPRLSRAVVLDPNGFPQRRSSAERSGKQLSLNLTPESMYVVLVP